MTQVLFTFIEMSLQQISKEILPHYCINSLNRVNQGLQMINTPFCEVILDTSKRPVAKILTF